MKIRKDGAGVYQAHTAYATYTIRKIGGGWIVYNPPSESVAYTVYDTLTQAKADISRRETARIRYEMQQG